MRRWLVVAVALGTVVGCAGGSASTSEEAASVSTVADGGVNRAAGERCPAEFDGLESHGHESAMSAEAARLEPTLAAVLSYGGDRPDEFAGSGLVWHSPGDASVFSAFKGDVVAHRQALQNVVAHPDELVVCQAMLSQTESRALLDELQPELVELFASAHSAIDGAISIGLPVSSESAAADLVRRYGERVRVWVGEFPYPMPDPPPENECEDLAAGQPVPGLEITVETDGHLRVDSPPGTQVASVRLRNTSDAPIGFTTGHPIGVLVRPGTRTPVSQLVSVGIDDVGIPVSLEPDAEQVIPVAAIAYASCDPAVGYRVPAGDYELVALLQGPDSQQPRLTSAPLPIALQ